MAADPAPRDDVHRLNDELGDADNVEEIRRLARRFRDLRTGCVPFARTPS
jgi:hypothetical protein